MQNIITNFEGISEEVMSKYAGQWVAVIDCKVVANGKKLKEVFEDVKKKYPQEKPLIGKVPQNSPMVLYLS